MALTLIKCTKKQEGIIMKTKDLHADLVVTANALKAVTTVFSDTFTSGSADDMARCVMAQPDTFAYLTYVISDYANKVTEIAEKLEAADFIKDYPKKAAAEE